VSTKSERSYHIPSPKHSGVREKSSIAISPWRVKPRTASNLATNLYTTFRPGLYLQAHDTARVLTADLAVDEKLSRMTHKPLRNQAISQLSSKMPRFNNRAQFIMIRLIYRAQLKLLFQPTTWCPEKVATLRLPLTLPKADRFAKFFHQ